MSTEYGGDQIQILEGLEAVRKRPGMYIGSTSSRGLHHLVYEIVDNAVDEALAGFCSEIKIDINEGDTITVIDNGRGIPVDINHKAGKPAVEVVFTILHIPKPHPTPSKDFPKRGKRRFGRRGSFLSGGSSPERPFRSFTFKSGNS